MSIRVDLVTAAAICGVKPGTIRKWTADQRLTVEKRWDSASKSWRNYYDVDELLHWNDARDPDALYSRAGLKPKDRPPDTRHVSVA